MPPDGFWNHERIDALRARLTEDMSASEIADALNRQFGSNYTRNAICGKIMRMKLGGQSRNKGGGSKPLETRRKRVRAPALAAIIVPAAPPELPPELPPDPTDTSRRCLLLDLDATRCHYPFGDASPFQFCGCQPLPALPYCGSHAMMCYRA